MLKVSLPAVLAATILAATVSVASGAENTKELLLTSFTVGANLEVPTTVALSEAAPVEGLVITLTSADPAKVKLATTPDQAGSASITMMARGGFRATPEFYIQGLQGSGSVAYSATATGFKSANGTVKLAPAAIAIGGPAGANPSFLAVAGSRPTKINVFSVALDDAGNAVPQLIAGGLSATVELTTSVPAVGSFTTSKLTIQGGLGTAGTQFLPTTPGQTTLAVSVPAGFAPASKNSTITANVIVPGIGVTENVTIGQNLQVGAAVSLGTRAGQGGVRVTLTSDKPDKLILSNSSTEKGTGSITITIPESGVTSTYFLQALGQSGTVTYTATATGYKTRTGTITLAPSGVVMVGPLTLPEGQLLRPAAQGGARQQGFLSSVSAGKPTRLYIHTVQLDPVSHRAADITIQALRAGLSLTVDLKNSNPNVGTIDSRVTIEGGTDHAVTQFVPKSEGPVALSVVTPAGFTEASNDAWLQVIVSK